MVGRLREPIDLTRRREPFILLPRSEREWIQAHGVVLASAIRRRDGPVVAVVLLGPPFGRDGYDRAERWFVEALLLGASTAWPDPESRPEGDEPADECDACGAVRAPGEPTCCAAAKQRLAVLPRHLAGKYTIARRLGAGGMGIVYLAHDHRLGRDVALKTLPSLSGRAVAALRSEAKAMGTLNHPAIATIYGVEVWRGTPVLVLEYFPEGTLADRLQREVLTLEHVLDLGITLADALGHVHERGVLHRDIKPSNIGITANGAPKLLDFGLAAADEPAGTRRYLPPEALAGAPPDRAIDLWGLAMVLHLAAGSDPGLSPVIDRALSLRPSARFQTGGEMREALMSLRRA